MNKIPNPHISAVISLLLLSVMLGGAIWAVTTQQPERFIATPEQVMKQPVWPATDQHPDKPFSKGYHGVDISHHQGNIRWDSLGNDTAPQPSFIYVRVMGRGAYYDSLYHHNIVKTRQRHIPVGTYIFYSHFISVREQFRRFVAAAHPDEQDLIPMIDVEPLSLRGDSDVVHLCDSVLLLSRMMERHYGCKPIIYSNQNFYRRYLSPRLNNHLLWIANYSRRPVIFGALPILWQYSESGHVPGIFTSVDLDKFINGGSVGHLMIDKRRAEKNKKREQ